MNWPLRPRRWSPTTTSFGTITNVISGCGDCVQAAAAGIVVTQPGRDGLEFLAATNHRARHLELYQVQVDEGPGVDCAATGQAITAIGLEQVAARWLTLDEPFRTAGFTGVHAAPMTWQGDILGALNLFFAEVGPTAETALVAQAFADVAALVIVHTAAVSPDEITARTRAALAERVVIERARGVIAYPGALPMDAAFDRLVALARDQARPLTVVAAGVIDQAATATAVGPELDIRPRHGQDG